MSPRKPPTDVAASVRARLLNRSRERKEEFQLVLSDFAIERFLHRLGVSCHRDQFVLKGAMLLKLWAPTPPRATWDVDLLGRNLDSPQAIAAALKEICSIQEDDGLSFDPASMVVEEIHEEEEYAGVRVRLVWNLAGARIAMQIDVGTGDSVVPAPRLETYPTLLDHPAPRMLAYPRETVVAEKLEAILTLGPTNSRMKDFYDLWLLASKFDFDGGTLIRAIRATFERRRSALPGAEPRQFTRDYFMAPERGSLWNSFWRRNRPEEPIERVERMAEMLQRFLGPVCIALAEGEAFAAKWTAGGPWK